MANESAGINPDFACYNHPDRQATKGCWRCQQLICDECGELLLGRTYCRKCAAEVEQLQPEPVVSSVLKREVKSPTLMVAIIIITLIIAAVEIYIMTR
jgi:hypothetical protein